MRLTELNPKWVSYRGKRLGITFDCPHCRTQKLGVAFVHDGLSHLESELILSDHPNQKIWTETNPDPDTFDNLSLNPSIDCSASGHWHGFINNGDVS